MMFWNLIGSDSTFLVVFNGRSDRRNSAVSFAHKAEIDHCDVQNFHGVKKLELVPRDNIFNGRA